MGVFALCAGLIAVVQAALIGAIRGNSLLVLGQAFLVSGIRHGTQVFASQAPRMMATLTLLAIATLVVLTRAHGLHTPAAAHAEELSIACARVLLVVFVASIPVSLAGGPTRVPSEPEHEKQVLWPLWTAEAVLGLAGLGAAFVSHWFVAKLTLATQALHLSNAFVGVGSG